MLVNLEKQDSRRKLTWGPNNDECGLAMSFPMFCGWVSVVGLKIQLVSSYNQGKNE
jgi:hypothetical protein